MLLKGSKSVKFDVLQMLLILFKWKHLFSRLCSAYNKQITNLSILILKKWQSTNHNHSNCFNAVSSRLKQTIHWTSNPKMKQLLKNVKCIHTMYSSSNLVQMK